MPLYGWYSDNGGALLEWKQCLMSQHYNVGQKRRYGLCYSLPSTGSADNKLFIIINVCVTLLTGYNIKVVISAMLSSVSYKLLSKRVDLVTCTNMQASLIITCGNNLTHPKLAAVNNM